MEQYLKNDNEKFRIYEIFKYIGIFLIFHLLFGIFSIGLFAASCDTSDPNGDPDGDNVINLIEQAENTNRCIHNNKLESVSGIPNSWGTGGYTIEYNLPDNFFIEGVDSSVDLEKSGFIAFDDYVQWEKYGENYTYSGSGLSGSIVYTGSISKIGSVFYPFTGAVANYNSTGFVSLDISGDDNKYYGLILEHTNMPESDRLIYIGRAKIDSVPPVCSIMLYGGEHEQVSNSWEENQGNIYLAKKTKSGSFTGTGNISVYSTGGVLFNSYISGETISMQCDGGFDLSFSGKFITKMFNTGSITLLGNGMSSISDYLFEDSGLSSFAGSKIYTGGSLSIIGSGNSINLSGNVVGLSTVYFYGDGEINVNNCSSYSLALSGSLALPSNIGSYTINRGFGENSSYKPVASIASYNASTDDIVGGGQVSIYESGSTLSLMNFSSNFYLDGGVVDNGLQNIIDINNVDDFHFSCNNQESISSYMEFETELFPLSTIKKLTLTEAISENANIIISGSGAIEVIGLNGNLGSQFFSGSSILVSGTGTKIDIVGAGKVDNLKIVGSGGVLELSQNNGDIIIKDCSQLIKIDGSGSALTGSIAFDVSQDTVYIFTGSHLIYPGFYARESKGDISPWTIEPLSYQILLSDNMSGFYSTGNFLSFYTGSNVLNIVGSTSIDNLSGITVSSGQCNFVESFISEAFDKYNCLVGDTSKDIIFPEKNDLSLKIDLKDRAGNTFVCKSLPSKVDNKEPFVGSKIVEDNIEVGLDILTGDPVTFAIELDANKYRDGTSSGALTSDSIGNSYFRKSDFRIHKVLYLPYSGSIGSGGEVVEGFYYEKGVEFLKDEGIEMSTAINLPINFKIDSSISVMSGSQVVTGITLVDGDAFAIKYSFNDFTGNGKGNENTVTINSRFYAKVLGNISTKLSDLMGDENVEVFEIDGSYQFLLDEFKTNLRSIYPDEITDTVINSVTDFQTQYNDEIIYKIEGDIVLSGSTINIAGIGDKKVLDLRNIGKPVTIWSVNGNIYIDSDYLLSSSGNLSIISSKHGNGSYEKGNILIKDNVQLIQATMIADGSVFSYANIEYGGSSKKKILFSGSDRKKLFRNQLVIEGSIVSKNTIGGYSNLLCPILVYGSQGENNICDEADENLQLNLMKMYDLHYLREYYYLGPSSYSFSPGANLVANTGHLVSGIDNIDTAEDSYSGIGILDVRETVNEMSSITDNDYKYLSNLGKRFQKYSFEYFPVVIKPLKPSSDMTFFKGFGEKRINSILSQ